MSSATHTNMGAVGSAVPDLAAGIEGGSGPTMPMTDRQLELDRLWRYYRCANYEGRKYDWNGQPTLPKIEHEVVATEGFMPAGFYDAGQTGDFPLKFRRPTAPFYLAKVIVRRFTSLLFSQKKHPKIAADDPLTEDWLTGFADATRLWVQMAKARNYGGAMGSSGLGFKIVESVPYVEVHDPRWVNVDFADREELIVRSFEKKYQFPKEVINPLNGEREEQWFWYRRVIDEEQDSVWNEVPVDSSTSEEPQWDAIPHHTVAHNFGFCPIVWIQNTAIDDAVDGDPDCHGIYDTIEAIDALWSQANRGTVANCDPTVAIVSDADFMGIRKGSGNALQVEKGGSVNYLEMTGEGGKAAVELAEKLEEKALIVARCVLDTNFSGPARTVEEVDKNYSNMIEQCDELREQYGERGVKRLLAMVLKIARQFDRTWVDTTGPLPTLVRGLIKLPKKRETDEATGQSVWLQRQVGLGEQIELTWPNYFEPSQEAIGAAVTAAGQAKQYALVDAETATKFVAPFFQIENIREVVEKAKADQQSMADAFAEQATAAGQGGVLPPPVGKKAFG